jgi:hypothetical protein
MATEKPANKKRKGLSWWQFSFILVACGFCYIASYALDSFYGGYWLIPEMDGRDHLLGWWTMSDAFLWQPRWGHEALGDFDIPGILYQPLIAADRRWIHRTIYLSDRGFDSLNHLKVSQVHPEFRDDYQTKITVMAFREAKNSKIRCILQLSGSDSLRSITEVQMSRDLAQAMEISPPEGFVEEPFGSKFMQKEYIRWIGKIPLIQNQNVVLDIPSRRPDAGSGRIRFQCSLDKKTRVNHNLLYSVDLGEIKIPQVH